jgi:hypothetical protein
MTGELTADGVVHAKELRSMKWAYDDLVTGERLQAIAEASVLTPSIAAFHVSLRHSGARNVVVFPGTHLAVDADERSCALLRGRRSIFVYSHLLESFCERVLPRLDHRFVLISHNSDHGVDARFRAVLDDPRIIHWFAQNALVHHPKLTPLPIGLANAQWPHGDVAALVAVAARGPAARRDEIYVNFEVRTNPAVRAPLLQRLAGLPAVWHAPSRPFALYLADMAGCRWVVSPPGNGVDCHRTWEALYLGVTPIVQSSEWGASLHEGLPIIQVPDLGGLNPTMLSELERALPSDPTTLQRLKMSYWRERIQQAAFGLAGGSARASA